MKKILVANRGEIAIRILRAANELHYQTVAIYAAEDRLSLHRFKADEAYLIQSQSGGIPYLDIEAIVRLAQEKNVDGIHPGYGFLSENPEFAMRCEQAGIRFIGPAPETLALLSDKVQARRAAEQAGLAVIPASDILPDDDQRIQAEAEHIGYPVMVKAVWGGGGRGIRAVRSAEELEVAVRLSRNEALNAFGNSDVYLEKLIERARHLEVQVLADSHGRFIHLFERDCSIQRRNQKIVERAPAHFLNHTQRSELCDMGLRLLKHTGYRGAGTVEFLFDNDSQSAYFIEVNPRLQVEHTVTEQVTGIDIVRAQIRIEEGGRLGNVEETGVPPQEEIRLIGYALQCRITCEDPSNDFIPDSGRISAYRGANGFGVRLDGGPAYSGAVISSHYDSLLEKVTAWGQRPSEAIERMDRALREFRIRGISTNLPFLIKLVNHPKFINGDYTTRFIDEHPEIMDFPKRGDRATKILNYIAQVIINGHFDLSDKKRPDGLRQPKALEQTVHEPTESLKKMLQTQGPQAVCSWVGAQQKILLTDTTMRDAHQSLLATRFRTFDLVQAAPYYQNNLSGLFSMECWGGATFDVAMRFLKECPWQRLAQLREAMPDMLLQMLLRGSNAVGYTNYPDNVVRHFIRQAVHTGVDVIRIFDSLNWVENMRLSIDETLTTGAICEAAICYTGDILDPKRTKFDLRYYVNMAKELEKTGTHLLGIKDMAGLLKPNAARILIRALRDEVSIPIHLHTHDTSGISAATLLAAVEEGVDIVDAAIDSVSGQTSQPSMGSLIAALKGNERDSGIGLEKIWALSTYWEAVRKQYRPFEGSVGVGSSEVYLHEMPGGQFSNLKDQARSMGLLDQWPEVAQAYAQVNTLFGDIVKVTPSSKVVGDMALYMVAEGLTAEQVLDPNYEVSFPSSVVDMFRGNLGQSPGGFNPALQKKILAGQQPISVRPGSLLEDVHLEEVREKAEQSCGRAISEQELSSYMLYTGVFTDLVHHQSDFGDVSILPTHVFYYGMGKGEGITCELEKGKNMEIVCAAVSEINDKGQIKVFFELNGQQRIVQVVDQRVGLQVETRPQYEPDQPHHIGSKMPGLVRSVAVTVGQSVEQGTVLCTVESMKMEVPIYAPFAAKIKAVHVEPEDTITSNDLLIELG